MRHIFYVLIGLSLAAVSRADQLADDQQVSNHVHRLLVQDLNSVTVVKSTLIPGEPGRPIPRVKGQVEFRMTVEGNICDSDPNSLAVENNFSALTMTSTLQFYTFGPSATKQPCFAFSRPVSIRYTMELDYAFFDPSLKYSSAIVIPGASQKITLEASLQDGIKVSY